MAVKKILVSIKKKVNFALKQVMNAQTERVEE
jgi:hypothetical protein